MSINYKKILNESLLQFIKNVLLIIQKDGLSEEQICYITFLTFHPDVALSNIVKNKYPNEITIVLQHQFEELEIFNDYFSVKLSFNDIEETVKVPFASITNFADPKVNFYLNLNPNLSLENKQHVEEKSNIPKENIYNDQENKIINLDSFRNKNKIN